MKKYFIILFIFLNSISYSQTPDGIWKGECIWENETSKLTITFINSGGTVYNLKYYEKSYKKYFL